MLRNVDIKVYIDGDKTINKNNCIFSKVKLTTHLSAVILIEEFKRE